MNTSHICPATSAFQSFPMSTMCPTPVIYSSDNVRAAYMEATGIYGSDTETECMPVNPWYMVGERVIRPLINSASHLVDKTVALAKKILKSRHALVSTPTVNPISGFVLPKTTTNPLEVLREANTFASMPESALQGLKKTGSPALRNQIEEFIRSRDAALREEFDRTNDALRFSQVTKESQKARIKKLTHTISSYPDSARDGIARQGTDEEKTALRAVLDKELAESTRKTNAALKKAYEEAQIKPIDTSSYWKGLWRGIVKPLSKITWRDLFE